MQTIFPKKKNDFAAGSAFLLDDGAKSFGLIMGTYRLAEKSLLVFLAAVPRLTGSITLRILGTEFVSLLLYLQSFLALSFFLQNELHIMAMEGKWSKRAFAEIQLFLFLLTVLMSKNASLFIAQLYSEIRKIKCFGNLILC